MDWKKKKKKKKKNTLCFNSKIRLGKQANEHTDISNDLSSPTRSHKTTATTTDEASAGLSDQDTHCDRRINFRRSKICHRNYDYIYTEDTNCDVIPRTSVLVCRRLLRLSTAFQIDLDTTEIEYRQTARVTFVTAVVVDYVMQLCKT